MTKKDTKINSELLPEEQQLEEEIINHIDKAELAHIVELLPVPVNNPSVHSDFFLLLINTRFMIGLKKYLWR